MKTRNLATLALPGIALAGSMSLARCTSSNNDLPREKLSLKGTVERLRVDTRKQEYTVQVTIPGTITGTITGMNKSRYYDNILVAGVDDTLRIGVNFRFFDYGERNANSPEPVGVGDVIEFDLANGFSKNSDGTYQITNLTDFPFTALNGRMNFYEKVNKK